MKRQNFILGRPQSAKPGHKGFWGQASSDDINNDSSSYNKNPIRKQLKLLRQDHTVQQFARILPKKIQQDKERLYSQALQLKQNLNQTIEENIRLKTRITILQKQKDRMSKYIDGTPDLSKSNAKMNSNFTSKLGEKDNMIIRNLKRIVREQRQEADNLKFENQQIKKSVKYTKINEIDIQRKMLLDENKKMSALMQQMNNQLNSFDQMQKQNEQLKKYLQEQIEQNKQLAEENQKYEELISSLEQKHKGEIQKYQNREKKHQRQMILQKKRSQQYGRHIEDLKKQLANLQQNNQDSRKKVNKNNHIKSGKNVNIAFNSHTQRNSQMRRQTNTQQSQPDQKGDAYKKQNQKLTKQIAELKNRLGEAKKEISDYKIRQQELKKKIEQNQSFKPTKNNKKNQEQNNQGQSYEQDQFDKEVDEEQKYSQGFNQSEFIQKQLKNDDQIQKLKKQFEEQGEEQLYINKDSSKKNMRNNQKNKKQIKSNDRQKVDNNKKKKGDMEGFKNKKILSQIKELLTLRMKSQRYPFQDLKADILAAENADFTYADLCNMLINEPFFLNNAYTKSFLEYCYQKQNISAQEILETQVLLNKLRKVIENFELIPQEQQKSMIIKIAQMVSSYPAELEAAFEGVKNGEGTLSKSNLIQMFTKLQLEQNYIQLIIAQLSLCSDDLEHLNFHGFFQRFYFEDYQQSENNVIDEEQSQEQSKKNSSRVKKSTSKRDGTQEMKRKIKHPDFEESQL